MAARSGYVVGLVLAAVAGAVVAGVGVFFVVAGMKDANQWAGVLGFFIGVAGLAVSGYSAVLTRRSLTHGRPPAAGADEVSDTTDDGRHYGPRVIAGGGVGTAASPASAPSFEAGAGGVSSTISGGTFHGEVNQGRDFTFHQPPGSTGGTAPPAGASPARGEGSA
ncbi:hypothetical protein [Pilimelia terevasa]|nr:hypothetical protein [Pilimelia terevasa]